MKNLLVRNRVLLVLGRRTGAHREDWQWCSCHYYCTQHVSCFEQKVWADLMKHLMWPFINLVFVGVCIVIFSYCSLYWKLTFYLYLDELLLMTWYIWLVTRGRRSNTAPARCTRYNIMWYSLSVVFSGYSGFLYQ